MGTHSQWLATVIRLLFIVGAAYPGCTPGYNLAFDEQVSDTDSNSGASSGVETSIGGNARMAGADNAVGGSSAQHGWPSTLSTTTGGSCTESSSGSIAAWGAGTMGGTNNDGSSNVANQGDTTAYGGTNSNDSIYGGASSIESIAAGGSPSGTVTVSVANGGANTNSMTLGKSTGGAATGGVSTGSAANGSAAMGGAATSGIAAGSVTTGLVAKGGANTNGTTIGRSVGGASTIAAGGAATATTWSCPSGAVFCDDFEGATTHWDAIQGVWQTVADGTRTYQCTFASGDKEARSVAGDPSWSDYTATARMKLVKVTAGKRAHLAVRFVDANNWYGAAFYLSASGETWVELRKKIAGSSTSLNSKSFAWSTNRWYTVAFTVRGRTLRMSIDGVQQLTTTDASLSSGQIAVLGDNMQVRVDDVAVTDSSS